jgi:hypothetical protein
VAAREVTHATVVSRFEINYVSRKRIIVDADGVAVCRVSWRNVANVHFWGRPVTRGAIPGSEAGTWKWVCNRARSNTAGVDTYIDSIAILIDGTAVLHSYIVGGGCSGANVEHISSRSAGMGSDQDVAGVVPFEGERSCTGCSCGRSNYIQVCAGTARSRIYIITGAFM